MPAPQSGQIDGPTKGFLSAGGLLGEDAPPLGAAIADTLAQSLGLFLAQAVVLPGIPTPIDPITGSGASAGPGRLMPPPAGGPDASQLEGLAQASLQGQGLRGENIAGLAKAIAGTIAQGLLLFTSMGMVMPGIPIAGFVTAGPGILMPVPLAGLLQPIASGLMTANGLRGADAPALAQALAQAVDIALSMFAGQVMVAPGIPAAPGASGGPGRLI